MRYRSNKLPDDGSICAIGNGKMLIYETGADIWSMTGPVYTLPSFMCMNISQENDTVESFSERKEKNSDKAPDLIGAVVMKKCFLLDVWEFCKR